MVDRLFRQKNRKAALKYATIIVAIVCIAVLVLALWWIFDLRGESDYVVCKNDLLLRENIPDIANAKNIPPLRCKTEMVTIDFQDKAKAESLILEKVKGCWGLVGNGKHKNTFAKATTPAGQSTHCFICAVVHLDDRVKGYYTGSNEIDLTALMNRKLIQNNQEVTYGSFLKLPFKGDTEHFEVVAEKVGSKTEIGFKYPKKFSANRGNGDLFISVAALTGIADRWYSPFDPAPSSIAIVYYQPTDESIRAITVDNLGVPGFKMGVCDNFETLP